MPCSLEKIASQFAIEGHFLSSEPITNGLINATHLVTCEDSSGGPRHYIFQCLNTQVFPEPFKVMHNVATVTQFLQEQAQEGELKKPNRALQLIPTNTGGPYLQGAENDLWRCFNYLEGCVSFDTCENEEIAYEAAKGFGSFLHQVEGIPAAQLHETILDFHHTPRRYQQLLKAIDQDTQGRAAAVQKEIHFIQQREELCHLLIDQIEAQSIPVRVTHNDTKVNNVMLDAESHEAACVIDLDTVMPGVAAYDFGDLVRTTISAHEEDTQDLSSIKVRPSYFKALTEGFLTGCPSLTKTEILSLATAADVITLEVGMRFLTDFLEGDLYFQTSHPSHNLDRCRTQLALLEQLEANAEKFTVIIHNLTVHGSE